MSERESGKVRWRRSMATIFEELNALYDADEIGAVQLNIALRDGDVRVLRAYDDGFKILLIAAAAIGQRESLDVARTERDADGWEEPAGDRP